MSNGKSGWKMDDGKWKMDDGRCEIAEGKELSAQRSKSHSHIMS